MQQDIATSSGPKQVIHCARQQQQGVDSRGNGAGVKKTNTKGINITK
jgi:hypothetical protein